MRNSIPLDTRKLEQRMDEIGVLDEEFNMWKELGMYISVSPYDGTDGDVVTHDGLVKRIARDHAIKLRTALILFWSASKLGFPNHTYSDGINETVESRSI